MGLARSEEVAYHLNKGPPVPGTCPERPNLTHKAEVVALIAREQSVLLNFACDGESDLASLGRLQVLGATG